MRAALRLKEGDEIAYVITADNVVITKATNAPADDPFASFGGMGPPSGPLSLCRTLSRATSSAFHSPTPTAPTRQHRPALVVSTGGIGETGGLLWVVMITSAENRPWSDDVSFESRYAKAGLPAPSVVRPSKLATIEARHAERLGRIEPAMMADVAAILHRHLGFV